MPRLFQNSLASERLSKSPAAAIRKKPGQKAAPMQRRAGKLKFPLCTASTIARIATLAKVQNAGPSDARAAGGPAFMRSAAKWPAPARLPQRINAAARIVANERRFRRRAKLKSPSPQSPVIAAAASRAGG